MVERGDVVPSKISREAWNVAMVIDEEIVNLLFDCGLVRKEGHSKITVVIAKFVQLAINQHLERISKEQSK